MDILRSLFPENCFDNDIIIAHNLFMKENESKIINFLEKHDNNLTKIFIDNIDNLEYQDYEQFRLIHYICFHSTPEMIKYIIDKGVDLECQEYDGWKPIHFICRYSTPEMIEYIIDKGVDLEGENRYDGCEPIHYVCKYSTPEMIKYMVDLDVDLSVENYSGDLPINYIKDDEIKGYVKAHMDYHSIDGNDPYSNGYSMAQKKLMSKPNKSARTHQ